MERTVCTVTSGPHKGEQFLMGSYRLEERLPSAIYVPPGKARSKRRIIVEAVIQEEQDHLLEERFDFRAIRYIEELNCNMMFFFGNGFVTSYGFDGDYHCEIYATEFDVKRLSEISNEEYSKLLMNEVL